MITPFTYDALIPRVVFGQGASASLLDEAERLGCNRLLLLSTAAQSDQARSIGALIGDRLVGHFDGARMHTPTDVTDQAMRMVEEQGADGILSVGGGSTIGLGKAIAFRTDLPQLTVPTTYAGSELTAILGETHNGLKTTRTDARIRPETAVYDVDLTTDLPVAMSVTSALNAVAHAVEALYSPQANPIISLMAVEGTKAIFQGLPGIVERPGDIAARSAVQYGAWLCGICLGSVRMAIHHKLCHTLGGTFDLPHAETHAVVLPHALAYNQPAVGNALDGLKDIFGDDVATGMHRFALNLGAPTSLRELGMPCEGIEQATRLALSNPYPNPRSLEESGIRDLIARAWAGDPPLSTGEQHEG